MPPYDPNKYSAYQYTLPDCYIYLYHTDEYFILPQYPDSIQDSLSSSFGSQNALSRTAPVYSYNNSGPRSVEISLKLHRDMMNDVNLNQSNVRLNSGQELYDIKDDYIDLLVKKLQQVALPVYEASSRLVTPPMVAVRFADQVFIKGIVDGGITIAYGLPLLDNNKYALIDLSFRVQEVQPYDALQVGKLGSFRGLTSGLAAKMSGGNA